jgi:hypothetical protein
MYIRNAVPTRFVARDYGVAFGATRNRVVQEEQQMSENRKDLARELYEHRNDPEEWGEEAEEIEVKPRRSSVLSFRLPPEELDALEQAMARTGESLSEYIRGALAFRIHADAAMPMLGTLGITYGAHSGPYENDPDQIFVHPVVGGIVGMALVQGGGTKASFVPKLFQNQSFRRILATR